MSYPSGLGKKQDHVVSLSGIFIHVSKMFTRVLTMLKSCDVPAGYSQSMSNPSKPKFFKIVMAVLAKLDRPAAVLAA